jgi:hypothetical protein
MSEADAFGTLSGVMSYVQRSVLDTSSIPTYDEALVFLVQRGALVESIMAVAGVQFTPSTGVNPIPASLPALSYMTAQLNNVLTAIDVTMAYEVGEAPATSEKVKSLLDIAQQLEVRLADYIKGFVADTAGTTAVATDISTGGVDAEDFPPANSRKASSRKYSIDQESW